MIGLYNQTEKEREMKAGQIFSGLLLLSIIGGYIYGMVWGWADFNSKKDIVVERVYAGRLYLQSEEYSQFKKYLADNPSVTILKMEVLSSPDALVDFQLAAPPNVNVPYGNTITDIHDVNAANNALFITILGSIAVFLLATHFSRLLNVPV